MLSLLEVKKVEVVKQIGWVKFYLLMRPKKLWLINFSL